MLPPWSKKQRSSRLQAGGDRKFADETTIMRMATTIATTTSVPFSAALLLWYSRDYTDIFVRVAVASYTKRYKYYKYY